MSLDSPPLEGSATSPKQDDAKANSTIHSGKCCCGAVQVEVTGDPLYAGYCHCYHCRACTYVCRFSIFDFFICYDCFYYYLFSLSGLQNVFRIVEGGIYFNTVSQVLFQFIVFVVTQTEIKDPLHTGPIGFWIGVHMFLLE